MGDDWMQLWVNAAQMKAADQYTIQKLEVPSLELMEHAAQACVQVLEDEKVDLSHVCVVCGSGNNGGDIISSDRDTSNLKLSIPLPESVSNKDVDLRKNNVEDTGKASERLHVHFKMPIWLIALICCLNRY